MLCLLLALKMKEGDILSKVVKKEKKPSADDELQQSATISFLKSAIYPIKIRPYYSNKPKIISYPSIFH